MTNQYKGVFNPVPAEIFQNSHYACSESGGSQLCASTIRDTTYIAWTWDKLSKWDEPGKPTTVTVPYTLSYVDSVYTVSEDWMYAPLIQLRWKATDTPLDATESPSQPTPTDESPGSPDSFTATNETASASSSSGGLSTGAKAGAGVGAGLGGLLLLGTLAWFLTGYRRRRLAEAREARASDLPVKETTTTAGPPPMQNFGNGDMIPATQQQQPGSWRDSNGAFHQARMSGQQG